MSDSESDALSTPANLPSDPQIEAVLGSVVRDALKNDEEITTNLARTRAEKQLGLHDGFFKEDAQWKAKSRDLIQATVEDPASPVKPKKSAPKSKAGTKRKSDEVEGGKKKRPRKKEKPVVDSEDSDDENVVNKPGQDIEESELGDSKAHPSKPASRPKSEEESALSDPPDDESEPAAPKQNGTATAPATAEDDDSDLSSVIDSAPPKKKRGKKNSNSPTAKSKPKPQQKSTKSKPENPKPELSHNDQQIKDLQSWLLKCGIRKLWHRELAPFHTPKSKIQHLKSMLEEAGMTGRYSAEKARQIKEQRELKAELEAVGEYNKRWGHEDEDEDGEEEEAEDGVPKQSTRRLKPKGLVDFGDSGEDSD